MIAGSHVNGDDTMTEIDKLVSNTSTPSFGQLPSAQSGAVGAMLGNGQIQSLGQSIISLNSPKI